ncbi:MAG: hypothetical protein JWM52_284 [Candidatus Saccharibacteria bacterium]|nr:hypothetical protein [Candidatus Saccharibacteria bacterium]
MVSIKKQLDALLNQEMDRKNFLRYSGGIVLALIGVTGLVRILLSSKGVTPGLLEQPNNSHGYGSSKYGK